MTGSIILRVAPFRVCIHDEHCAVLLFDLFASFLIQISLEAFDVAFQCGKNEEDKKKTTAKTPKIAQRKNNEKRHNYMHA